MPFIFVFRPCRLLAETTLLVVHGHEVGPGSRDRHIVGHNATGQSALRFDIGIGLSPTATVSRARLLRFSRDVAYRLMIAVCSVVLISSSFDERLNHQGCDSEQSEERHSGESADEVVILRQRLVLQRRRDEQRRKDDAPMIAQTVASALG